MPKLEAPAADLLSMVEVERCSHSLTPEAGERLVATFAALKRSAEWDFEQRELTSQVLSKVEAERDRLRALVVGMREWIGNNEAHDEGCPASRRFFSSEEYAEAVAAGGSFECNCGYDALLGEPEEWERLRWAERRLANITQTCRSEFGQARIGEPAEDILDRVAEELRLLREYERSILQESTGEIGEAWAALRAFREGQK